MVLNLSEDMSGLKDFLRADTIIIKAWADGSLVRYVIRYATLTVYGFFHGQAWELRKVR